MEVKPPARGRAGAAVMFLPSHRPVSLLPATFSASATEQPTPAPCSPGLLCTEDKSIPQRREACLLSVPSGKICFLDEKWTYGEELSFLRSCCFVSTCPLGLWWPSWDHEMTKYKDLTGWTRWGGNRVWVISGTGAQDSLANRNTWLCGMWALGKVWGLGVRHSLTGKKRCYY